MRKSRGRVGAASLYDGGQLQPLNGLNGVRVKDASRESKANQANLYTFHESPSSPLNLYT